MLLRDHADLKAWLTESPPPSATPLDGEPPNLIVRSILYSFPQTIEFTLGSEAGTRYISVEFQDPLFAKALYDAREQCVGKTIQEFGYVDIS